jgi:hypothetical protein
MAEAVCRRRDDEGRLVHRPDDWFPGTGERNLTRVVKARCGKCPVRDACLALAMRVEDGLSGPHRFGFFGGLGPAERYELYRECGSDITRPAVAADARRMVAELLRVPSPSELPEGADEPEELGMSFPVRCSHCSSVYDLGHVELIARYADCSVFRTPCCGRRVDDRPIGFVAFPAFQRLARVSA